MCEEYRRIVYRRETREEERDPESEGERSNASGCGVDGEIVVAVTVVERVIETEVLEARSLREEERPCDRRIIHCRGEAQIATYMRRRGEKYAWRREIGRV